MIVKECVPDSVFLHRFCHKFRIRFQHLVVISKSDRVIRILEHGQIIAAVAEHISLVFLHSKDIQNIFDCCRLGITVLDTFIDLIGTMTMLLNIPVVLLCYKLLGRQFFLVSLKTMIISSVLMDVVAPMLPVYTGDRMLAAICTGVLSGLGYAMIDRCCQKAVQRVENRVPARNQNIK